MAAITFTPSSPQTVAPGATINLSAAIDTAPAGYAAWLEWRYTSGPISLALSEHSPNLTRVAETRPGTYTLTARSFWAVSGSFDAPLPGQGNISGNGSIASNETWLNDAGRNLRAAVPDLTPYFNNTGTVDNEGFTIGLQRADQSGTDPDTYWIEVVKVAGSWYARAWERLSGGTATIKSSDVSLSSTDAIVLRASDGALEPLVNGVNILTTASDWSAKGYSFRTVFAGYVTGMSLADGGVGYEQPTITTGAANTAASVQLAQFVFNVSNPAIVGPDTMAAGSTVTLTNGSATGGAWSATAGTITQAGVFTAPCVPGPVTVRYTSSTPSPAVPDATRTITVTAAPAITLSGNYNAAYVGGQVQFAHSVSGGIWSADIGSISQTGLYSATQEGKATITYSPVAGTGCPVTYSLTVYAALAVAEAPSAVGECVVVQRGQSLTWNVTGGSGSDIWTSDCPVSIDSSTGAMTAPQYALSCNVTLRDLLTGQTITIPLCVQGPIGTCVVATEVQSALASAPEQGCQEFRVECGGALHLSVPGIGLTSAARRLRAALPHWAQSVLISQSEPYAQLTSLGAGARALGNTFSAGEDVRLDVVVTPSMLNTADTRWGFVTTAKPSADLRWAVGVSEDRTIVAYEDGIEMGRYGTAQTGMSLGIGFADGVVSIYRGGIVVHRFAATNCGDISLLATFDKENVVLGGPAAPAWEVVTSGNAQVTGLLSQNGRYQAPARAGLIELQADVAGWLWKVNVRVVQATPRRVHPHAIWSGGGSELWLNVGYYSYSELPVLALDGSPDAGRNPYAIDTGETTEGFKFKYEREQGEITTDSGIVITTNGKENAMMSGEMVEVRDTEKLRALLSSATVRRLGGYDVVDFGGKNCICEMSAMLIKPNEYACDAEGGTPAFDILYLPRVVATSKGFEWNFKRGDITRLPFDLRVLPDKHRPAGAQLFSVYFSDGIDKNTGTLTTCRA